MKKNLKQIEKLKEYGLNFVFEEENIKKNYDEQTFSDQIWVITGSFENFKPRSKAAEEIRKRGGKITNTVSTKTTHILKGEAAGSKLKKALKLNINIVDEKNFLKLLDIKEK
jgi:DNA ligase (NAD+)